LFENLVEIQCGANSVAKNGEAVSRPREFQSYSQWWLPVYVKVSRSFMYPVMHATLNINNGIKRLY